MRDDVGERFFPHLEVYVQVFRKRVGKGVHAHTWRALVRDVSELCKSTTTTRNRLRRRRRRICCKRAAHVHLFLLKVVIYIRIIYVRSVFSVYAKPQIIFGWAAAISPLKCFPRLMKTKRRTRKKDEQNEKKGGKWI